MAEPMTTPPKKWHGLKIDEMFVDGVQVGARHRRLVPEKVEALVESIRAEGLLHPITVYTPNDGATVELVAGRHRLEAARKIGWEFIPAIFFDNSDEINRELLEIDENLCRAELTEAEEAHHLARRKELWEERNARLQSEQVIPVESKRADGRGHRGAGFASETAAITGETKQSINRKIARAEKIAPDVLEEITGSKWDKGVVLDTLKKLDHDEQRQAVERVQSGASPSVGDAYEFIKGESVKPTSIPLAENQVDLAEKNLMAIAVAVEHAFKAGQSQNAILRAVYLGVTGKDLPGNFQLAAYAERSSRLIGDTLGFLQDAPAPAAQPEQDEHQEELEDQAAGDDYTGPNFAEEVRDLCNGWSDAQIDAFRYIWTGPQKTSLTKNLPRLQAKLEALTPPRRRSRSQEWVDAAGEAQGGLETLIEMQSDFQSWLDGLPENLQDDATAEKLNGMCDLDLQSALDAVAEAADIELPMGFGRD